MTQEEIQQIEKSRLIVNTWLAEIAVELTHIGHQHEARRAIAHALTWDVLVGTGERKDIGKVYLDKVAAGYSAIHAAALRLIIALIKPDRLSTAEILSTLGAEDVDETLNDVFTIKFPPTPDLPFGRVEIDSHCAKSPHYIHEWVLLRQTDVEGLTIAKQVCEWCQVTRVLST